MIICTLEILIVYLHSCSMWVEPCRKVSVNDGKLQSYYFQPRQIPRLLNWLLCILSLHPRPYILHRIDFFLVWVLVSIDLIKYCLLLPICYGWQGSLCYQIQPPFRRFCVHWTRTEYIEVEKNEVFWFIHLSSRTVYKLFYFVLFTLSVIKSLNKCAMSIVHPLLF